MTCYNHPNVRKTANCKHCGVEMCGPCTQFLESGEYCEQCAKTVQAESFVAVKSLQIQKRIDELAQSSLSKEPFEPPTKKRDRDRGIIVLAIGGSLAMLFFSLL